ncbi:MAG: GDSL-type esterase/lipase family protein [Bacillota bacterium]|nr:GDSL-type esterase/lipase family protein [Bacillota bacterium]
MAKKILWYLIIFIACISLIFVTSGFYKALKSTIGSSGDNNKSMDQKTAVSHADNAKLTKDPNKKRLLILGDSIANGTGDESSKGIDGNLKELLKNQTSKDIVLDNAAIDGLKYNDLLKQLNEKKLDSYISNADYIIISIGGNDIREMLTVDELSREDIFSQKQEGFVKGLKEVISYIRKNNQNSMIVFLGLYNPTKDDDTPDNMKMLKSWNNSAQTVIDDDSRAVFIPTYDIFKFNTDKFISPDRLHPNSFGYQAIAYLIEKAIESTLEK